MSSHASLGLATVLGLRVRLSIVGDDFEREVLHVGLPLSVVELAIDEVLRVEGGIDGVHRDLILRGVTDVALGVGEGDIEGMVRSPWSLVMISTQSCCQVEMQENEIPGRHR